MRSNPGPFTFAILVFGLVAGIISSDVLAQGVPKSFWGAPQIVPGTPGRFSVEEEQTYLLWLGFYYGKIDGRRGPDHEKASRRFQASLGVAETGRLDGEQQEILKRRAKRAQEKAGFREYVDEWTGMAVHLPLGYLSDPKVDDEAKKDVTTVRFSPRGSSDLFVTLTRLQGLPNQPHAIFTAISQSISKKDGNKILSKQQKGTYFQIISQENDRIIYRVAEVKRSQARLITMSYPAQRLNIYLPIQSEVLSSLRAFHGPGLSAAERELRIESGDLPGYRDAPQWLRTMRGSGSGAIVSYSGHVLTNHHVVDGCARVTVQGGNAARLIGIDIVNDLALVVVDRFAEERRDPVRFRLPDTELGETVIVMGYPLFSRSQALNLTTGVVSARSGLYGDRRNIQITAPVQPGNSGGPVLDRDGNQVAVVVSKASSKFQLTANAENIAWVIRGNIARQFLAEHDVNAFVTRHMPSAQKSLIDVAAQAKLYTVRVECHMR